MLTETAKALWALVTAGVLLLAAVYVGGAVVHLVVELAHAGWAAV
jgi:hypothetical protein